MNCAECGKTLPASARFCSQCGRRVASAHVQSVPHPKPSPEEPALVRRTPARRAADLTSAATGAARVKPPQRHMGARTLPAALVGMGCIIGLATVWSIFRLDDKATAVAQRQAESTDSVQSTSQPVSAGEERFSARQALRGLYGNYDPVVDGAYWTVSGAPRGWTQWNGKRVAIKPLVSQTNSAGTQHVLVTSSVDMKNGVPMKQGTACSACKSLLGAALYERQGNEWQLVAHHRFLAVEGAWGAPPDISVGFLPDGRIALGVSRTRTSESRAQGPDVVLFVDAHQVTRKVIARNAHEAEARASAPPKRSSPLAVSTFPSSADGP